MLSEFGLILLLAVINGFFALSEMAVVVSRKSRLKQLARTRRGARVAVALAEHPERFLSTVQFGITLLMLLTGAVTGASLGDSFATLLHGAGMPWLASHAVALGWMVGFILATAIQIVIGELVPKRVALVAPERLACAIAIPMLVLSKIAAPFVWVLNSVSTLILKLLRVDKVRREAVTEEEIRLLVAEGAEQGVLDSDERNMVNRVLRLGDRSVDSVMTPRPRIAWLDIDAPLAENLEVLRSTSYSRYPVYRGDESDILGVVEIKRLLDSLLRGEPDLFSAIVKPLYVPDTARALDLLEEFRDAQTQMALVVDEYGDIEGLATLNDLLVTVVGQSPPSDITSKDSPIVRRSDGSWLIDGALATDDLRELLHVDHLPNEDDHDFRTAAGMLMATFGRIPAVGESFDWHGLRFEVVDLDGARIDKLLVTPPAEPMEGDFETTG